MSVIKVNCIDQVLTVVNTPVIASGGREENSVAFNFCSAWDGFSRIAVFWRDPAEPYSVVLNDEDTGVVPWEVLGDEGVFFFGVYGLNADGVRRTSQILRYRVDKGAYVEGAEPSDPTQELWEQLLARCSEAISKCSAAVDAAANKADRPESATAGHLAALTADGHLADSGKSLDDLQPQTAALPESAGLATADLVPFYDTSAGVHRRTTWGTIVSKIKTAIWGSVSGFVKVDGSGGISGVDTVPVANGGTGATTAAAARTALGLGSVAVMDTVPVANGGTGATTAASARIALGLGSVAVMNTIPVANGGTNANNRNEAFKNLAYLGVNPVTEETDTIEAWSALGFGVAYISGNGVLKGQPTKYGFVYNYTVGGNLIHQVFQSCSTSASTYHRCGGEGAWYNTSWVMEYNAQNLNPATLDATGKVAAVQASANLVGIDASATLDVTHCGKFLRVSSSSAITITIPDSADIPNETEIEILRYGAGNVTISAASNIGLRGIGSTATGESYKITDRYGVAVLKRIGSATWIISGAVEKV